MVKCAEQSPRICDDGSIRWYEGDTFIIEFDFTFKDDTDTEIEIQPTDKVTICFTDLQGNILHTTEVVGTSTLEVEINDEATALFKKGKYNYCVRRVSQYRTTVMRFNRVVVE